MYVKITNGIPETYTIGQLRKDNPNVSFPKNVPDSILAEYNVFPVTIEDDPVHDAETQWIRTEDVTEVGGVWTIQKTVVDKTAQEIADHKDSVVRGLRGLIRGHLDDGARSLEYEDMVEMITYKTSTIPKFATEATQASTWRDDCWAAVQALFQEYKVGTRARPTTAEVLAALPAAPWV